MKLRSSVLQRFVFFPAASLFLAITQAATFTPLGFLPDSISPESSAYDVSADGKVVVGDSPVIGSQAFRWTASEGMRALGSLPGVEPAVSVARGVSADGFVIVGLGRISASESEAFRWTEVGGVVGLGDMRNANAVSADGSVVVGGGASSSGYGPLRWTLGGGMVGLGSLSGGSSTGTAFDVSADGSVVVGNSDSASGTEAFRWTAATGMVGLGDFPFGDFFSRARSVSADGAVIAGWGSVASGKRAMRWTAATGMVSLGTLPGCTNSEASDISGDGLVIVGSSSGNCASSPAFVWTAGTGMRSLLDVLIAQGATGLEGWTLRGASAASATGQTIVGSGRNPSGRGEAWVATLDIHSFNDVRHDYWAFSFIETLAASGITAGCGNDNYCPSSPVTRAQMAVFLERGIHGSSFSPPAASGNVFLDVSAESFAASFIEQFFLDGITSGCGGNNYCPSANVTRAQMAVFLLRAKHGSGYSPPPAIGVFNDVPLSHWAVHWIEQLAAEGITAGCGEDPAGFVYYCPDAPVTRDQMAVFLVRTFGL